jgi:hypothetical protein
MGVHRAAPIMALFRGAGPGRLRRVSLALRWPCRRRFSHTALEELYGKLWPLRTDASPFEARVKDEAETAWVKPKLAAEVKFAEWTQAGEMRKPTYLGLREHERAEDVVVEETKFIPKHAKVRLGPTTPNASSAMRLDSTSSAARSLTLPS